MEKTMTPQGRGKGPLVEVADILCGHGHEYRQRHPTTSIQQKVMHDLIRCRTPKMGGHLEVCDQGCGYVRAAFHSCRNRHCPKCQSLSQRRWLDQRKERILPTRYFHLVVTLPEEMRPLALRNKAVVFKILFHAAANALLSLCAGYQRLQAHVGFTAVLHTWNQDLQFHPHLHIVVTGGGLDAEGRKWIAAPNSFLVPVKALSKIVRGKFLDYLGQAFREGRLRFSGRITSLAEEKTFDRFLKKMRKKKWVLYAKRPFGGPEQVYGYLSRYTHKTAISNFRLVSYRDGRVTFTARDNNRPGQDRLVTMTAVEFLHRFLDHVLPHGFVRIRHYGLLSSTNAKTKLETARALLLGTNGQDADHRPEEACQTESKTWQDIMYDVTGIDLNRCPHCGRGTIIRIPVDIFHLEGRHPLYGNGWIDSS
jgi:hypothetical protein